MLVYLSLLLQTTSSSLVQVFTDGLTNKLLGGWREGGREDTVLVR